MGLASPFVTFLRPRSQMTTHWVGRSSRNLSLQFWRMEIQNQGVRRLFPLLRLSGDILPAPRVAGLAASSPRWWPLFFRVDTPCASLW